MIFKNQKGYSRRGLIALCSLVYFVSYFSRKDFAAVMAGMILSDSVSRADAGLIGTMLFVFYGGGQLISGYLGDKIKPKNLIILGLSVTALCNTLMPLIPEWAMIIVWGVNGLAQAMLWPPIVKILSTHLDHKTYVTANLVVTSAAHVATVLLYAYTPICLTFMSWEAVFYTASALALASAALFAVIMGIILPKSAECVREALGSADDAACVVSKKGESVLPVLRKSGIFTVLVCIVVVGFLRDGIESWLPTLYAEAFAQSASDSTLASIILPVFSILSITAVTALHRGGLVKNEVSGSAILFCISLVFAIPLAVFLGMSGTFFRVASLLLTALICAIMHGINFLLISCLPGRFADIGRSATVSGICNSCVYLGAAIATYGIALVSEHMGWTVTVFTWCGIIAMGIVFALLSHKRYKRMIEEGSEKLHGASV